MITKMKYIIWTFSILVISIILTGCGTVLFMRPAKTGQIQNTNIHSIRNGIVNVYLINTGNGYIMVDAGTNIKRFEASLAEIGVNVVDIKWILLTHSDGDHVAGLALIPDAEIYMSEDELVLINGTIARNRSRYNSMPDGIDIDKIILLSDAQELTLNGIKIETIKAPGHTPGSMLYLVEGRYLFTGDAFRIVNRRLGVHPFTMDKELSEATIERLRETVNNSSLVLTSHYGVHDNIRN